VSAVNLGGKSSTKAGSRMEISATTSFEASSSFTFLSASVMTTAQVTSAPVPEVVGIFIKRAFFL